MHYQDIALYIHIPFCSKICPYCAFYKKKWDKASEKEFIEGLIKEIDFYQKKFQNLRLKTIFFGGGTPTILRVESMGRIFDKLRSIPWVANCEITMEMNPELSHIKKLTNIKQLGVNRVSVGVQSLVDSELLFLGRGHTSRQCLKALDAIRESGIDNLNCDVIFGLPNSSIENVRETLTRLMVFTPEHISTYNLSIEPGTEFKRKKQKKADEELEHSQYTYIISTLNKHGYDHYEVSNFAKPGLQCKHNVVYWESEPYIGLGPGAHSFFDGIRYHQARDLDKYSTDPTPRVFQQKKKPSYPLDRQLSDFLMMKLRLKTGVSFEQLNTQFDMDFRKVYDGKLSYMYKNGLIYEPKEELVVTQKGWFVLDSLLGEF